MRIFDRTILWNLLAVIFLFYPNFQNYNLTDILISSMILWQSQPDSRGGDRKANSEESPNSIGQGAG